MNYAGCKRKFDIARYAAKWSSSQVKLMEGKRKLEASGGGAAVGKKPRSA